MLEEIVKSGSQLILKPDEGMEQPVEVLTKQSGTLKLWTTMKVIEMTKSGFDKEPNKPIPMLVNTSTKAGGISSESPVCSQRR